VGRNGGQRSPGERKVRASSVHAGGSSGRSKFKSQYHQEEEKKKKSFRGEKGDHVGG
jgi:hypothetical protein